MRNVHHTRTLTHSAHTSQQPVFTLSPPPCVHTTLFALQLCEGRLPQKMLKQGEGEQKIERKTKATIGAQLSVCFGLNVTGSTFYGVFFSRGRHQSCTCATSASGLVATLQLGVLYRSSLIITLNVFMHTCLLPSVYCTNCVASGAFSIEAAQLIYTALG